MKRCPMMSSVSDEQCREADGHPCVSAFRFHRFTGPLTACDWKSWCVLQDSHDGNCETAEDREHHRAHPTGCADATCFTCIHVTGTKLPPGLPQPTGETPPTRGDRESTHRPGEKR